MDVFEKLKMIFNVIDFKVPNRDHLKILIKLKVKVE